MTAPNIIVPGARYNVDLKKYTVNSGPPVRSVNVDKVAALAIMGMAGPRAYAAS